MTNYAELTERLDRHYVAIKYPTGVVPTLEELAEDCRDSAEAIRELGKLMHATTAEAHEITDRVLRQGRVAE